MKRVLGIDYGEKRIGLAISDPLGITAQGLPTLDRKTLDNDIAAIAEIVREKRVGEIALGMPVNMDGSLGDQAKEVEEFAAILRDRLGLPVRPVDERLTTVRAERAMRDAGMTFSRRRSKLDRASAQLILQSFLDRERSRDR